LKAIALKTGWQTSAIATGTYTMNFGTLAAPAISPAGDSFTSDATVTLTSVAGATVRYTLDGSTPTTASPIYNGPLTLTASATLRAKAWHPDYTASPVSSETYTIVVAAPSFTPTAGAYPAGQTIHDCDRDAGRDDPVHAERRRSHDLGLHDSLGRHARRW
jgi:hypothetical protein